MESRQQLEEWLLRDDVHLVRVDPYQPDSRIGWDTHLVLASYPDGTIGVAGFTDGPVDAEGNQMTGTASEVEYRRLIAMVHETIVYSAPWPFFVPRVEFDGLGLA